MACPKTREEIVEVLRFADEHGLAVIPFGEESSLEGHTIPTPGLIGSGFANESVGGGGSDTDRCTTDAADASVVNCP